MPLTPSQKKQRHLGQTKVSGSLTSLTAAQKAAVDKEGYKYNLFTDKNGKMIKQNNVVKFNPGFLKFAPGNWQMFPSASAGRSDGDGEIVFVNLENNWNFKFDLKKFQPVISASFIEFVEDGPQ